MRGMESVGLAMRNQPCVFTRQEGGEKLENVHPNFSYKPEEMQ